MGKGASPKQQVTAYYLSQHFGFSRSVDAILQAQYGEKEFWSGEVTASQVILIDNKGLFGGEKSEGGVAGAMTVLMGEQTQTLSEFLASKLGRTPSTVSGWRGKLTLFFTEDPTGVVVPPSRSGSNAKGFYWSSNSGYLKDLWLKVRRVPKGLDSTYARLGDNVNFAHIIYEALTNDDWGSGDDPAKRIDTQSFLDAAQTLYNEGLVGSLSWTQQQTVDDFVNDMLSHIEGVLIEPPRTGLRTLKLIRNDYDASTLPVISPDDATLSNFQRLGWGETTNEVSVTWTNPDNEETETVTFQDPGNVAVQAAVVTSSVNYYGIRSSSLALQLAERECRKGSAPLCSCDAVVDQRAWDWVPGDCITLTWPEHGLVAVVMRIMTVQYGKPGSPGITVTLLEDVFALPTNTYANPPASLWVDPSQNPADFPYVMPMTMPYLAQALLDGEDEAAATPDLEVKALILAAADGTDTSGFDLYAEGSNLAGVTSWNNLGARNLAGYSRLPVALGLEFVTTMPRFQAVMGSVGAAVGNLVLIGGEHGEFCMITGVTPSTVTLQRGVLDTIPQKWDVLTQCWIIDDRLHAEDTVIRAYGQTVGYKLLSKTSRGVLLIDAATEHDYTFNDRPHQPYRPANVKFNGLAVPPVAINYADLGGTGSFTWANRNRLTETALVLGWTDASVTPEAGQTTVISIYANGALVTSTEIAEGLTTGSLSLVLATIPQTVSYGLSAKRDGLLSWQQSGGSFDLAGYGVNYGNYYGGAA